MLNDVEGPSPLWGMPSLGMWFWAYRKLAKKPLIPEPWRQKQVDLYEFEASLVSIVSSRTARAM